MSIRDKLKSIHISDFKVDDITIKEITTEKDLGYATVILKLKPEQENLVNPTGFSIGRAFLNPTDNIPCIIYKDNNEPIGFISLCKWSGSGDAYSWSYFIDKNYQNMGYGTKAAKLAIHILKTADPNMKIKLAVENCNIKAQSLYISIGFSKTYELDGDDFVYSL